MSKKYLWRVFCPVTNDYETIISEDEPLVCPSDGVTPVDPQYTVILEDIFKEINSAGYIKIESSSNEEEAVILNVTDSNGGILIKSIDGNIKITSDNGQLLIGNSNGSSMLIQRYGSGFIQHQKDHINLTDSDATLTSTDIMNTILVMNPTNNRTLTLPNAMSVVANIQNAEIGDSFDFTIINTTTTNNLITLSTGTIIGNPTVGPASAKFKLRITNVTSGMEAYSVYRIY